MERKIAWLVAATLLAGCTSDRITAPDVVGAVVAEDEAPLARTLTLDLSEPAPVTVEYSAPGVEPLRVASRDPITHHRLYLARLLAGRTYHWRVVGTTTEGTFTTDPLPEDLARLTFTPEFAGTVPLVMVHAYTSDGFKGYVVVDRSGEVVWYWRTTDFPFGMTRLDNGDFVFMDKGRGLVEVTPGGAVVHELPQDPEREMHHDVITLLGYRVLFIAYDTRPYGGVMLRGDAIWEWSPLDGGVRRMWTSWDHLSPETDRDPATGAEWLHANSLGFSSEGGVTLSLHNLNQVVSISPDFERLTWRLGGIGATLGVRDEEAFSGQHTAREVAAGRVFMFDNGLDRGGYSRAVEFEIDGDSARQVWEWRPERDNFTAAVGSARRLANGGALVAFGLGAGIAGSTGPTEVYEVDAAGHTVWHLLVEGVQVMYRAEPMESVGGEVPAGS